jgi:hypothetical protein
LVKAGFPGLREAGPAYRHDHQPFDNDTVDLKGAVYDPQVKEIGGLAL